MNDRLVGLTQIVNNHKGFAGKSGIYGQIYFFAANGDSSPQYFVVLKEIITFVRFTDTTPK
jgi:hypothetical protein